jgi:ribosomal 50S subunit-recycling heat shock protein
MRLDLVLKFLCLAKSRSAAKVLCDHGDVKVNGGVARAATIVHAGDVVAIHAPERALTVELLEVPAKQASKADAPRHYRVVT